MFSQFEIVKQDNLIYSINKEEKTASIIGYQEENSHLIIRRSIIYEMNEYIITKISQNAFKFAFAESIIFSDNLELETIEKSALYFSDMKSLTIPKSLINLEERWCDTALELTNIKISPENPRYRLYEDKLIIGKSKIDQENYDTLVFCVRNAKNVKIPNFIKYIDDYAFDGCIKIKNFEISENSELYSIGYQSIPVNIESIFIPKSVLCLENECFSPSSKLTDIKISSENPKYKIYENFIVSKSTIEKENYDSIVYYFKKDMIEITIPNFIEIIEGSAFRGCSNIKNVIISKDSKLRKIGKRAFIRVSIDSICLPSSVIKICADAFFNCEKLTKIEFPKNSQLKTLENEVFASTKIESFFIPSNLIELNNGWCRSTNYLNEIDVDQNNPRYKLYEKNFVIGKSSLENENFDVLVFCVRNIKKIKFPCFIEMIDSFAFNGCTKIKTVKFQSNSKLKIIGCNAFYFSSIEFIEIQSSVNTIENHSFSYCKNLQYVDIQSNSELQTIGEKAFHSTLIKSFSIPNKVRKIGVNAFDKCHSLKIIEFNSQLEYIDQSIFGINIDTVIMVPPILSKRFNLSEFKLI